jgi:hypothetical protein
VLRKLISDLTMNVWSYEPGSTVLTCAYLVMLHLCGFHHYGERAGRFRNCPEQLSITVSFTLTAVWGMANATAFDSSTRILWRGTCTSIFVKEEADDVGRRKLQGSQYQSTSFNQVVFLRSLRQLLVQLALFLVPRFLSP